MRAQTHTDMYIKPRLRVRKRLHCTSPHEYEEPSFFFFFSGGGKCHIFLAEARISGGVQAGHALLRRDSTRVSAAREHLPPRRAAVKYILDAPSRCCHSGPQCRVEEPLSTRSPTFKLSLSDTDTHAHVHTHTLIYTNWRKDYK